MASGFSSAVSGIEAAVLRQDVTANNVANINTPGFMRSRVNQVERAGGGTAVASITRDTRPGPSIVTERPTDIGVRGDAFIEVQGPNGRSQYTRSASLRIDSEGFLALPSGQRVSGAPQVPPNTESLAISADGSVVARTPDILRVLGRLNVVRFSNAEGLQAMGGNLFEETAASGPPMALPFPALVPGELVGANTDLAAEIIESILARAGLDVNVEAFQTLDDMSGTILDMAR
jgi:flagellar basal-body rod protein FlgG